MYHSLIILLHRPFVSEGHLHSASSLTAQEALSHCVSAACEIHNLLQLYRQHFCMKTAPYFTSYATYVCATIQARIAAQKGMNSVSGKCLRTCLEVLTEQQAECHAPRRIRKILIQLVQRLGLQIDGLPTPNSEASRAHDRRISDTAEASASSVGISEPNLPLEQAGEVLGSQLNDDDLLMFDSSCMDVNIDDIIKSFDTSFHAATHVQNPGNDQQLQRHLAQDLSRLPAAESTYTPGQGIATLDCSHEDPASSGLTMFPDSLFGFDFDLDN